MNKLALGLLVGLGLGLLDGASAAFNPAARAMLLLIIVSATAKGALTGVTVGFAARKFDGVLPNMAVGGVVGAILSVLASMPTGAYVEIIPTGVAIGVAAGLIVDKWGRQPS